MMGISAARIVHIGIDRPWREVYDFVADPDRMALWASGLASGLTFKNDHWTAQGPLGSIEIRFSPRNDFGVVDHEVTLATGAKVHNALRVIPNGADGAEVMFALFKLPEMDEDQFAADAEWVMKDLTALKTLLER